MKRRFGIILIVGVLFSLTGQASATLNKTANTGQITVDSGDGKPIFSSPIVGYDGTVFRPISVDGNGNLVTSSGSGSITVTAAGKTKANSPIRVDLSSTPITVSAYGEVVHSTAQTINEILINSGSNRTFKFGVGASGSESPQFYIGPGASGSVDLAIPAGSRISIEPVEGTANSNAITFSFLK